jgi:hypothetical protein
MAVAGQLYLLETSNKEAGFDRRWHLMSYMTVNISYLGTKGVNASYRL